MFIRQRDLTINPLLNLPPGGLIYFKPIWGKGGVIETGGLFKMGARAYLI